MLFNDFKDYIETHQLLHCDLCIVGVSGGPDSMCLLDLILNLRHSHDFQYSFPKVVVAHIHHGLRGKDADEDLLCVQNYCDRNNLILHIKHTDVISVSSQQKMSIEHAGRIVRHDYFDQLSHQYAADYPEIRLALAHHKEDKAETMMMNLFRGSGLDGLCAMPLKSGKIIRPLLFASKAQIMLYLDEKKVEFRNDQSNESDAYTRNVWRNKVFPLLKSVAIKDPVNALVDLSELLEEDKDYIDLHVKMLFKDHAVCVHDDCMGLACRVLLRQHPAIAGRMVRALYAHTFLNTTDLSSKQIKAILQGVKTGKSNLSYSLSNNKIARIDRNILFFDKLNNKLFDEKTCSISFSDQHFFVFRNACVKWTFDNQFIQNIIDDSFFLRVIDIDGLKLLIEHIEKPSQVVYNSRVWYCPASFLEGLVVRAPQPQDRVSRAGNKGSKLLRRYLTDCKLPSEYRSRVVVFAHANKVLWVPGIVHAEGFVDALSHEKFVLSQDNPRVKIDKDVKWIKFEILNTEK